MQKLVLVMSTTVIFIPCLLGLVGRYHFRDEWKFKWRLEMGGHLRGCLLVGQQLMVCYTAGAVEPRWDGGAILPGALSNTDRQGKNRPPKVNSHQLLHTDPDDMLESAHGLWLWTGSPNIRTMFRMRLRPNSTDK